VATYTVDEAHKWLTQVNDRAKAATLRGLNAAALRTVAHIQNSIIPSLKPVPVARGIYRAGWHVEKLPNGAHVVNTVAQAMFIEHGVRAENVKISRPMIEALAAWVRMKGIGGKVVTGKGGRMVVKRATQDEATAIAWAIAKTMQKKGIFGDGFKVLEQAAKMIPGFIQQEVQRELKREFGVGV
jgi:hypothetical protein